MLLSEFVQLLSSSILFSDRTITLTNQNMRAAIVLVALAAIIAAAFAATQQTQPKLTVEANHERFGGGQGPGGHRETIRVTQDAWVSKNGNIKAGGYVQHDREKFGGAGHKNTHGGIYVGGTFG